MVGWLVKDAHLLFLLLMLTVCCVTKLYATILVLGLDIKVLEHSGAVI